MRRIILTLIIFLIFIIDSFGQINPIQNLTWEHEYVFPNNYFTLAWDEPMLPHNELVGYNVYRENELYRFQTENSLFNLEQATNCGEDFLIFGNGEPFVVHVTAIYNPNQMESTFTETVMIEGPLLNNPEFEKTNAILYPNPTNGILNIGNKDLSNILIFDISGKVVKEFKPQSKIDLSDISKGLYLIQLISDTEVLTDKIIIK